MLLMQGHQAQSQCATADLFKQVVQRLCGDQDDGCQKGILSVMQTKEDISNPTILRQAWPNLFAEACIWDALTTLV